MKKNSRKQINPKKNSCYGQKKINTRNLITKKEGAGKPVRAIYKQILASKEFSQSIFFCPEEGFKVPIALSLFAVNDPFQLPSVNLDISLRSTVTHTEELGQS